MNFFEEMSRIKPLTVIHIVSCMVVFLVIFFICLVLDNNEKKANVIDEVKKNNVITNNTYVTAEDMLFDFYNQYLSPSLNETERHELIKNCCTPNMLEMLDILYSFDEEEGLIIGIDYDPFLNAQDVLPIESIKTENQEENKYKILWNETNNIVTLNVIKDNNTWKIDSFDIDGFEQIKKDVVDYWNNKGKDIPKVFSK